MDKSFILEDKQDYTTGDLAFLQCKKIRLFVPVGAQFHCTESSSCLCSVSSSTLMLLFLPRS